MFHFPAFPPDTLFHSDAGNRTQLRLGSPIRTPPDQRSVANSPGLIAGSHVLHRLSMPRHPPCALSSLPTQTPHTTQQHLRPTEVETNSAEARSGTYVKHIHQTQHKTDQSTINDQPDQQHSMHSKTQYTEDTFKALHTNHTTTTAQPSRASSRACGDARVHYPDLKLQETNQRLDALTDRQPDVSGPNSV